MGSCNCSVYSSAAMKTLFLFFCSELSLLIPTTRGVPITGDLPAVRGADCDRPCYEADSFHCIFNWRIVNQFLDCMGETDDCYGDGTPRQATLVSDAKYNNISIPGPAITVCHGDEVSVNVVNDLESDATTIHWHGLAMSFPGTTFMLTLLGHTGTTATMSSREMMGCMALLLSGRCHKVVAVI